MIAEMFIEGERLDLSADISSLLTFNVDECEPLAANLVTVWNVFRLLGITNRLNLLVSNNADENLYPAFVMILSKYSLTNNAGRKARICGLFDVSGPHTNL